MTLGKRIARRMKALDLTQAQLAQKLGVTQQAVSKYLREQSKPGYDVIAALSKALGVTPAWFFEEHETAEVSSDATGLPPNTFPSPHQADLIVFPHSGFDPERTPFVIGHWLPMQRIPPPILAYYGGIISNLYELIFNPLAQRIPCGQMRGALAIDWKPVEMGWLFQLRNGVRFHDGKPLAAGDVRWSYELYLGQNPHDRWIQGVEVLDEGLIQIDLKSPCRLEDIAMPLILPEGREQSLPWIGTGPFQVMELEADFWRLKRNPHYFFSTPYFPEIHIRYYPNPHALEQALVSGEVHFAIGLHCPGKGYITKKEATAQRYQLHFFLKEPLVQNRALRRAIALALDREALAKAIGLKAPFYSAGPFDYILGDRHTEPPPPDPEAARQLLTQVPELKNSVFRVKYYETDPRDRPLVEAIVEQLNRVGIPSEIGDPPHALLTFRDVPVLEVEYKLWVTSSPYNLSGYDNPEVDHLIQQYKNASPTPDQFRQLRQLIQQDLPDIPLFYNEMPLTYVKRLRALESRVVLLNCLNEIHTWYLERDLAVDFEISTGSILNPVRSDRTSTERQKKREAFASLA